MSVYSTQFFCGALTAGSQILYTVPTLQTVVMRDLEAYNGSGATSTLTISVYRSGSFKALIANVPNLAGGLGFQWTGRAVLNPGDELEANPPGTGWTLLASGYLLTM